MIVYLRFEIRFLNNVAILVAVVVVIVIKMSNSNEKPRTLSLSTAFHDCKIEQKECMDNCTILYHLLSKDLHKFAILNQVFGACNVIKLIQVSCNNSCQISSINLVLKFLHSIFVQFVANIDCIYKQNSPFYNTNAHYNVPGSV